MAMNNKQFHFQRSNAGFSILEIVIVTAVTGALISLVVMFIIEANRITLFLSDQSEAILIADKTVSTLSKQLRETTDGDDGSFALVSVESDAIAFYSDVDKDEQTEYLGYTLEDTNLVRTMIEPSGTPAVYDTATAESTIVAQNIVNSTETGEALFTYFDTNNAELSDPVELSSVTLVRVRVDVNAHPEKIPDTHSIETTVQLRNLNDNL